MNQKVKCKCDRILSFDPQEITGYWFVRCYRCKKIYYKKDLEDLKKVEQNTISISTNRKQRRDKREECLWIKRHSKNLLFN